MSALSRTIDDSLLLPGLGSGIELEYPARVVMPRGWLAHTPFAMWLVGAHKPSSIVELGVHTGNSYCAFLQGVHALGVEARCFGVDHWRGDEHAGLYDDEIYRELSAYHDPLYGTFSTLLRCSFDEALSYFSDGSVDLLHIDGFHTYEAVSSDFASWLPKMSSRGVVVFHDTNVRERGFGIWRFWEEIASRYPHFEFVHSHGLGIAYLGAEPLTGPLAALLAPKTDADVERIRTYFARLGTSVVEHLAVRTLGTEAAQKSERVKALEIEVAAVSAELAKASAEGGARAHENAAEPVAADQTRLDVAQANQDTSDLAAELVEERTRYSARIAALEAELCAAQSDAARASTTTSVLAAEFEDKIRAAQSEIGLVNASASARVADLEARLRAVTLQSQTQAALARQRMTVTTRLQRELLTANLERVKHERKLEQIHQSTSWRMTGPVRRIVERLKRR